MKFIEDRRTFEESMKTLVVLEPTREALAAHLRSLSHRYPQFGNVQASNIEVLKYKFDDRVGWTLHAVSIIGFYTVIGYTDGPPLKTPHLVRCKDK